MAIHRWYAPNWYYRELEIHLRRWHELTIWQRGPNSWIEFGFAYWKHFRLALLSSEKKTFWKNFIISNFCPFDMPRARIMSNNRHDLGNQVAIPRERFWRRRLRTARELGRFKGLKNHETWNWESSRKFRCVPYELSEERAVESKWERVFCSGSKKGNRNGLISRPGTRVE
jgi:hypothetical protein